MDFFILIRNLAVAVVATVTLLVGLLSAPWQVLLIILICGVVMSQWLIERHHLEGEIKDIGSLDVSQALTTSSKGSEAINPTIDPSHTQALSYRGASYAPTANATEEVAEAAAFEVSGKYRGGSWQSSSHTVSPKH